MFQIDKNSNITITRGDSAYVKLKLFDASGKPVKLKEYDEILFTVSKSMDRVDGMIKDELFHHRYKVKEANYGFIMIESEDTMHAKLGDYFYDVRVIKHHNSKYIDSSGKEIEIIGNSDSISVIPVRRFKIIPDISRVEVNS